MAPLLGVVVAGGFFACGFGALAKSGLLLGIGVAFFAFAGIAAFATRHVSG